MFTIQSIARKFYVFFVIMCTLALSFGSLGITPAYAQAATWYVAPTGNDLNSCADAGSPCFTINGALGKAAAGDVINVAVGTYTAGSGTQVVLIDKAITLSGGWDASFTTQSGLSIIDGQAGYRGITTTGNPVVVDHFHVQHGFHINQGGGIRNNHGTLTINNSIVSNNVSHLYGGGIDSFGTLTINNSTISGNSVGNGDYGNGGGIETYGGTLILNDSTISGNTVLGYFSKLGSAIDNAGALVTINNSTISGNIGAVSITNGNSLTINNSTVTGNTGGVGGDVVLQNSILAGNNIDARDDCDGTIESTGYNLIGNNANCTFIGSTGDQIGTADNPIDPLLGPLQDNGGPTFTHAPLIGSPALGAGNPATPGSGGSACLANDQRGIDRSVNSPCDVGAYEEDIPNVIAIKRANSSPTNVDGIDFIVTFPENVTGINLSAPFNDFALTTTGVTGASISAASGSGNMYIVSVDTGFGDGTIRLDIADDDSIEDLSGNPLGGTGIDNGDFTTGETYIVSNAAISSIVRADADPTHAFATVNFTITFEEAVVGIDTNAPFSDFALMATNITGPSIVSVSGSGDTYTVAVNTGSGGGNGTLRLDVIDDDSIQDLSGNPLGGTGNDNGNYSSGEVYTVINIPAPLSPASLTWDTTPTYTWNKILGATQYQYQLTKGAKTIYSKTVAASACGVSTCSNTPKNVLLLGAYTWKVRVMLGGVWTSYSPLTSFKLVPAKPGFWQAKGLEFYVVPNGSKVDNFAIYVSVSGCGKYKITRPQLVPINGATKRFSFLGSFYATGTLMSPTSAAGTLGLKYFYLSGCGYVSGGPFSWVAKWKNANQPLSINLEELTLTVEPTIDAAPFFFDVETVKKP